MKQIRKALSILLVFATLLTLTPVMGGSARAASDTSLTTNEQAALKSYAIGEVTQALMDAVGECPQNEAALRDAAAVIFDAIEANDAEKSPGLAILGQGMIGAMKRCYINDKQEADNIRAAAEWIVAEITQDGAAASIGLGKVGAALVDAGGETGKFEPLRSEAALIVNAIRENDAEKGKGLSILGQGMIGAMKRRYMNNKPEMDDIHDAAAWIVDEIAQDDAAAGTGLGKVGAALMDAIGEVGHSAELRSDTAVVVNAFAAEGGAARSRGLVTLGQAMVGAMKRRYINNKQVMDDIRDTAKWITKEILKDDAAASVGLGRTGAALMDAIGEVGHSAEFRSDTAVVVNAFAARGGAARGDGLGILGQAMVGAMKRRYINNKQVMDDIRDTAKWITKEILKDDAAASVGLGGTGAALMDTIGEVEHSAALRSDTAVIVNAFAGRGGAARGDGLGILGQAMVGAMKRRYLNKGDDAVTDDIRAAAAGIVAEIAQNDAEASVGLGYIGAALMDAGGETGEFEALRSDIEGIVKAFRAKGGAAKSEGLTILGRGEYEDGDADWDEDWGEDWDAIWYVIWNEEETEYTGRAEKGMLSVMKRRYLKKQPVTDDMRAAAEWIVKEIAANDAAKSKSLGKIGAALVDSIEETGEEDRRFAELVVTAIKKADAAASEGLGTFGVELVKCMERCYLGGKPVTDEMYAAAKLTVDAIIANDTAKGESIARVGAALVDAVAENKDMADALCDAASVTIAAIAANSAAKSGSIKTMDAAMNHAIKQLPAKEAELRAAAASILAAITANGVSKGKSLCGIGKALLAAVQRKSKNAERLLDTANTAVALITALDETYTVSFDTDGGTPIPASQDVLRGETASRPAETPEKSGFDFAGWYTSDQSESFNFAYGITADTTVVAKWLKISVGKGIVIPATAATVTDSAADPLTTMTDLDRDAWYASGVNYVLKEDIMQGMGDGTFAPDATASRAQIAQILFNISGDEPSGKTVDLADVSAEKWYADAVTWLTEHGIAQGEGEIFNADGDVTREQLAVMLYHFAQYKGYDVSARGDVSAFPDASEQSDWARDALAWAVGVGLLEGTTNADGGAVLNPQGSATRAQIAVIFERFCEKVAK